MKRRDIFLKIEPLVYTPLAPVICSRDYGRDCMFNEGHEMGRLSISEIMQAQINALVYRQYLDSHYMLPNKNKIISADINEPAWNNRVPGAVLYAKPGERLYIHVLNGDKNDCHSFHLHGVKYGIESDGAWPFGVQTHKGQRSDEIKPGQSWTYVFDATEETIGAWAFHDHAHNVQANVNRGLFGGLIIQDPKAPCADAVVPLFIHQMAELTQSGQFQSGTLSNGNTFSFKFDTVETCPYHCLIHGTSMSGTVQVTAGGPASATVVISNYKFVPANVAIGVNGTVTWQNNDQAMHIVYSGGGGASTFCLNGRAFVGNTPTIVSESGNLLRWHVFNLDLATTWHNFHPHSMRWQIPGAYHGASDVHSLSPVESFTVDTEVPMAFRLPCHLEELQCNPPEDACYVKLRGDFLFHCHIEEHMMKGLAGLVRAQQHIWISKDILKSLDIKLPFDNGMNDCECIDTMRCSNNKRDQKPNDTGMNMGGGGMSNIDMSEAAKKGIWELLPCDSQVLAVHAALLHNGKILFFSGSGNDPDKLAAHDFRSVVWDYEKGGFFRPSTPIDFFCAGHAFLPDGRLLVAGGTKHYDGFEGLEDAYLFNPADSSWTRVQDMHDGRWYPALVTLGDGSIFAISGASLTGPNNRVPEIYTNTSNWASMTPSNFDWPLYPSLFLLQDGNLFYAGATMGGNAGLTPLILAPHTNTVVKNVPGLAVTDRDQGASVILPPAQDQKIMVMGGSGSTSVAIADLKMVNPSYNEVNNLQFGRMHLNAVLLPDRTVFVSGGSKSGEDMMTAVRESEIYHPLSGNWTLGATATVARLYHSIALLLPDGRVITAGSNPVRKDDELRLELYHPPYLFRGPRPFIANVKEQLHRGLKFEIETPQATQIKWVHLIKPMATTHSWDSSQRLIDIPFTCEEVCHLQCCVPEQQNIVIPGWYMLFIVNHDEIPSIAKWIQIN